MPVTRRNYLDIYNDGRIRIKNNSPVNNFNGQSTTKALLDIVAIEGERIYDSLNTISVAIDPTNTIGSNKKLAGINIYSAFNP